MASRCIYGLSKAHPPVLNEKLNEVNSLRVCGGKSSDEQTKGSCSVSALAVADNTGLTSYWSTGRERCERCRASFAFEVRSDDPDSTRHAKI